MDASLLLVGGGAPALPLSQRNLCCAQVCQSTGHAEPAAPAAPVVQVPGEMFSLAMEAKRQRGMGVVGSTQNILDFIAAK